MPQKTKTQKITEAVIEILKSHPTGLRYTDIVKKVREILPEQNENLVTGVMYNIEINNPKDIFKVKRGFYKHTIFKGVNENGNTTQSDIPRNALREQDFYESFADYLKV